MTEEYKDIDVLFIIPPVSRIIGYSADYFPLGPGYIVSYFSKAGIKSKIYNADYQKIDIDYTNFHINFSEAWLQFDEKIQNLKNPVWSEIEYVIKKMQPKIIGIPSKIVDTPSTNILTKLIRKISPDIKIIIGGPSATTMGEYILENIDVDFLVLGEGEETMLELTQHLLDPRSDKNIIDIMGISFKQNNEIVTTAPRPLIEDINTIPFPDRDAMFYVDEEKNFVQLRNNMDVLTSRGCPYPCKFCSAYQAWGTRKPRYRNVDNIIEEIKFLKEKYNQGFFVFWDDLFTVDRKRITDLCNRMIDEKIQVSWLCLIRVNDIDKDLIMLMKRAGCMDIQIGVESGSDRVLGHIRKRITVDLIKQKAEILRETGIRWRIFLIIGFPSETLEEMVATLNIIDEIKPTVVDLSIFCPYPGTDFYDELKVEGKIGKNLMKIDTLNPYNNFSGVTGDKEFGEFALKALKYVDEYNSTKVSKRFI